jgi:hypothetical protein
MAVPTLAPFAPLRFTVTGVACCGAADVVEFVVSARRVEHAIAEASRTEMSSGLVMT